MPNLQLAGMTFVGQSDAGIATTLVLKEHRLCFDLGEATGEAISCDDLFVSHAHTDHLGGIFNYLAVRRLQGRNMANIYVPAGVGDELRAAIALWGRLSASKFDYRVFELHPGAQVDLRHSLSVLAFPLEHHPVCHGYLLQERVVKVTEPYRSLEGAEIRRLKLAGTPDLFHQEHRPLFAYVPDTLPQGLENLPEAAWQARVLAVEASFLDDRKPMDKVRQGKHLHLRDLVEASRRFKGKVLMPFHFSRAYHTEEIRTLVEAAFPPDAPFEVHPFIESSPR